MGTSSFADVEIGQVRLRCRGEVAGETALRLRVDHLLGSADIQPVGMSPSAVLIVRRLADPLPGRLAPHEPRVRVDRSWEQATRSALASVWQAAARPVAGVVPAGAEAILFDDEASLLALLAADVCAGRANERWWWQALPRSLVPPPGRLDQLLLRQPRLIPAIIHQLAAFGELGPVVAALTPRQAGSIVVAMLSAYGMTIPTSRPTEDHLERASQSAADVGPIWDAWTPPHLDMPDAGREHQCLVGLGLGLFQAPAMIRGAAFQQRFHTWWSASAGRDDPSSAATAPEVVSDASAERTRTADMPRTAIPSSEGESSQPSGAQHVTVASGSGDSTRQPELVDVTALEGPGGAIHPVETSPISRLKENDITTNNLDPDPVENDSGTVAEAFGAGIDAEAVRDDILDLDQPELDTSVVTTTRDAEPFGLAFAGGFRTELGGFAYLINLMCRLDLPDCFEDDWRLATAVGPWGTLELLARALAGSSVADDALWSALAALAGRPEGTPPGLELVQPTLTRLPETWLPADAASGEWQPSPLTDGLGEAAVEWLRLVMPVVRYFLSLRLEGDDPGAELLRQPGQVYISATHVDVVLPLDAISIPIRIAGLDRDPGWLPDFGR
ncbi:MAG TPA: hypothetical protein VFV93_06515, partial [Thermomicrobiales bacterium]|nr:hypothetical protein [Thermomicrobiales bacterium]